MKLALLPPRQSTNPLTRQFTNAVVPVVYCGECYTSYQDSFSAKVYRSTNSSSFGKPDNAMERKPEPSPEPGFSGVAGEEIAPRLMRNPKTSYADECRKLWTTRSVLSRRM